MSASRAFGRPVRALRDDRLFLIATEDTYAAKQYLEALRVTRATVVVLPTGDDRHSAPQHVLERARSALADARRAKTHAPDDQAWLLLDTDHWIEPNHIAAFTAVVTQARQAGIRVAVSNPCFEAWLYLHLDDLPTVASPCEEVVALLKTKLGAYNKTNLMPDAFVPYVPDAIRRAEGTPADGWPQTPGSQVVHLVRELKPAQPT